MEVLSLYSELPAEGGGRLRVCYRLLEEQDGGEVRYGLLSFIEGGEDHRYLPGCFGSRRFAELVLGFLAERGVLPYDMENTLAELFTA